MQWYTTPDLLHEIFAYLPVKDLYSVAVINKLFNTIALKFKRKIIANVYDKYAGKNKFSPSYELLLHDAHIRQKFVNYLRDVISTAFAGKLSKLTKILSRSIDFQSVKLVSDPFHKAHINYIIRQIIIKYDITSELLCDAALDRKVIYVYLHLINKFPADKLSNYFVHLPDDFDFEL